VGFTSEAGAAHPSAAPGITPGF